MKFPTEINVRGHEYLIEYVECQREVDRDFESENYLGVCDCDSRVIRVLVTKPPLAMFETLIHEVIHAIFTRNKMLKTALKPDIEEEFITTLASEVALILFDNQLVKFPAKGPPITTRIVPEARS